MRARSLVASAGLLVMAGGALVARPAARGADRLAAGQQVFAKWCAPCHADQPRLAGTLALQNKYQGAMPASLEKRTDLTPDVVRYFVRNGVAWMAPFRKTEISDAELAGLAAYLSAPPRHRPKPVAVGPSETHDSDRPPPHG